MNEYLKKTNFIPRTGYENALDRIIKDPDGSAFSEPVWMLTYVLKPHFKA